VSSRVNGLVESTRESKGVDIAFEERVAIMMIDGGLTEDEAQTAAYKICYHKQVEYLKRDGTVETRHTLVVPEAIRDAAKQVAKQEEPVEQMSFEAFQQQARSRFNYE